MTLFSTPFFNSSNFTYVPGLPEELQLMVWAVSLTQFSPPLGETTVIDVTAEAVEAKPRKVKSSINVINDTNFIEPIIILTLVIITINGKYLI